MGVRMIQLFKVLYPMLLSCFVIGCNDLPTVDLLVGTYAGKTQYMTEELVLRGDGTYQQRFESLVGTVTTNSGIWRIHHRVIEMDGWLGAFDTKKLEPTREPKRYQIGHCKVARGILHWNEGAYMMRKIK